MVEVQPPHPHAHLAGRRVFLAGSIEMGAAEDWQARVARELADVGDLVVLNPRRDDWDASWEQRARDPRFKEQVEWELDGLEAADVIAMYLAPETKAPISLLELGLHAAGGKLVVCCPDGYWRKGNVEIVCARHGAELFASFDAWLAEVRRRVLVPG